MAKKTYRSPLVVFSGISADEDPTIVIGPSQGSSGIDSPFTFVGIDDDTLALIELNCDDFDLDEMDTNDDFIITLEEFEAWFNLNEPW